MIKKGGKVKSRDFAAAKKPLKIIRDNLFLVRIFKNQNQNKSKFSFVIPKKVEKKAVLRNKAKRMGFAVLKEVLGSAPQGFMFVFNFNKMPDSAAEVDRFIRKVFKEEI